MSTSPPSPNHQTRGDARAAAPASLADLQRRLIDPLMLWCGLALVLTHGIALNRALDGGTLDWPLMGRLLALSGLVLLLVFRHRVPYTAKVGLFLLGLWTLAALSILVLGPAANSKAYVILLILIGMLFLQGRWAWLNVGVGGLILTLIGIGAVGGDLRFPVDWERWAYSPSVWVQAVGSFIVYSAIVAWIALRLVDSLSRSVAALQARTEELQQTTAALERALERQQALFNNAAAGIALLDGERRILMTNPVFAHLLGYTPEQLAGQSTRLIHLDQAAFEAVRERFYAPLNQRNAYAEDIELRCADGGTRWTHASLGTLHPGDPTAGTVLVLVDIEQRKRTEQALAIALEQAEAANRAKGRFLAAVSHELRTPLHAILGSASVLGHRTAMGLGDATARSALASIEAGGQRLLGMIDDLIDIARLESGADFSLRPEPVRLAALLHQCEAAAAPLARIKSLGLSSTIDPRLPACIQIDKRRLAQIVQNLLGNAVKYTERGEIRLRAELDAGAPTDGAAATAHDDARIGLRISVQDTGPGISPTQQQPLFQAFQQVGQDHDARGSGLGLAIAQGLARRMGGEIRLDSRVGEGSTFTLHLPDIAACPASDDPAGPADGALLAAPPVLAPQLAARLRAALDQTAASRTATPSLTDGLAADVQRAAALAHATGHEQLADWSARARAALTADADAVVREGIRRALDSLAPTPPTLAELHALRQAALTGSVGDLERWCERLRAAPGQGAFVAQVERLLAVFEHARIVALAEAYIDPDGHGAGID